ncbi:MULTISPECIES: plasmid partition protein ParG [Bacteroidales]|jgi:hypothetical protein|uniref:Uncharacterized protein n=1 Tax=Duncaniella dubosii TaxID=2518971 RepID=A0A4P7W6Y7_9BACT|nr:MULTISPECIES: plasmid partition protein ParG [Bacteroidales]QCD43752.1 hypothetical protein E7747_15990 [Duncaniella dubosii]QCD43767.1 hypothetical protein E7747_16065 [Duncaniella dubosii]QCD43823.1 hypothetical protein E7747_16385 [Duncaniella dubosii]
MAKNKILTVPQNGTQPATIPSPIDNMLAGTTSVETVTKTSNKRPTSFNIDQELQSRFKAVCATRGKSMSSVIEDFILGYISEQ